jgi:hypothetical protein
VANLALNTETTILCVKNATYFGTTQPNVIPNRSQIHLRGVTLSASGQASTPGKGPNPDVYFSPAPAVINFRQIRNPTSGAPAVWTPYNNGVNQVDSDGSNIYGTSSLSSNIAQLTGISGGATGFDVTVACGATQFIDFEQFESVAYPGDVLCFTANVVSQFNSANVNVAVSLTWNEDL